MDFLKRTAVALYLKAGLKYWKKQAEQTERIADSLELLVKLEALKADIPLSAVKEAEEGAPLEVGGTSPAATPEKLMELLAGQTPEELDRLDDAFAHAEQHFGRGKVPESLDLYGYAETLKPDNVEEMP
jgi:hypothetical protein